MTALYEIKKQFNHVLTKEVLYKVKVIYPSGGVVYLVLNEEQLKNYMK